MSTAVAPVPVSALQPLPTGRLASVGAIIFFANAAMLVLQLVAGRLLAPFIGSSLETWTSIIGVFLAGIALGNGFGGRIADRYPTPRTLAFLLGIGAIAALWMLIFPELLSSTGKYKSLPLGARIPILATLLCLPAGFVLSLLTPLAIKLGLPDVGHTGRVAGLIFSLSTLGCLTGNYLTGFYLIPSFTINMLVVVSAGVLIALAAISLLMKPVEASSLSANSVPTNSTANPHAFPDIRRAYLIVFLASFCGMTLELTASRVLAYVLGVSLFTWTGVIGVMLAGTALGNFTGGQLADRAKKASAWLTGAVIFLGSIAIAVTLTLAYVYDRDQPIVESALGIPSKVWAKYRTLTYEEFKGEPYASEVQEFESQRPELLPRLQRQLALGVLAGTIVGAILASAVIFVPNRSLKDDPNPRFVLAATLCAGGGLTVLLFVTMALITRYSLFETWEPITQVMVWTFSLFFLPMFVLGLVSPQVIRLSVPDVAHVGRVAGRVYAWSTVGAIVGTFAAGYVLLSNIGMYKTLLGTALVLTLASLLVVNVWKESREAAKGDASGDMPGAGVLLYLFAIVLGGITGGFILLNRESGEGVIAQVESNYYTIKVSQYPVDRHPLARSLNLDKLMHSVVDPEDPSYLYYTHEHIQMEFLWLAEAELQEPREPKSLVIGGGGYTFPRYAMETMPNAKIDVVEIDPKVTQVAHQHLGLSEYPNLRAIHMDGRQFVAEKAVPGSYDLIIQDAVNDLSVPAHLMTKEYNDAVKVALKPDGVYLLTIIDSVGNGKLWKAAMATLALTYPPENVVLLADGEVAPYGTPAGDKWDRSRHVMVIYASDKPFSRAALKNATLNSMKLERLAEPLDELLEVTPGIQTPILFAVELQLEFRRAVHTYAVPAERLKPFIDREPGIVLTDQFCPIDNLMAEVFRARNK